MSTGKKIIFIIISATVIILLPDISVMPVVAQTFPINTDALMARVQLGIAALVEQIQQLQAQFNILKGTNTNPIPSSISAQNIIASPKEEVNTSAYSYTRDLAVGSRGVDVMALQQTLINEGYLKISEPTTYFGPMTKIALAAWQEANSISPASGYFGLISQAKIAELAGTSAGAAGTASTSNLNEQTQATFIKTYHLWDKTAGFGVLPLKNGGYLLTGDIVSGAGVYYPFIIKTDTKGNILWSKRSGSPSNVYSISSSRHIGRIAVETTDGNIVMVSDTLDFISAEYEKVREAYGDVLITKLNSEGAKLWSIMIGDYSTDQPQKLWALSDGGVMVLARFRQTGYGNDVADTSVVPKYSILVKIDKNGQVLMSKKMSWDAIDMALLADGSFIALANIAIPQAEESQIMGTITATAPLPTILKLNNALNVEWAKTMEMVPSELSIPSITGNGSFTIGVTKIRMPGGDFKAIQPAPDGGFIAFGYASLLQGMSAMLGDQQIMQYANLRPFIAVKVDATGKYLWARKLTGSLFGGTTAIDFQVARTTDNSFVILQEVVRDKNWQTYYNQGDSKALERAWATNIELVKTDADFNARWVKKFDVEKNLSGYDVQPTADGGVAVTGIISTNKTHIVMGSVESYGEAILIKADVNGGVGGCVVVSDHPEATVEDQCQYLIMQDMSVAGAKVAVLNVNKKVNEKISVVENTARNICEYQRNNAAPISSYLNSNIFTSQTGMSVALPVAKTWALINFENAKEGKIESEKNRQIHEELLLILNQIFSNQVKMTDSMNSMWLTYCFSRLATRADVEAVWKYYEGLGYKIDESESGTLNVSKIGLSLRMTFYINNLMKGKLDVMF